jgi:predicted metalloprotease with PDZ domain
MTGKQGLFITLTIFGLLNAVAKDASIRLDVDATEVAKNLLHARLQIPATPGKLTLYYPKWIPGEHSPSGPINSVTGLKFSANGKPIEWQRDAEDMFQFNVTVPAGADSVEVALDFFPSGGGGGYSAGDSATSKLLILSWNQLLLYPKNERPLALEFSASLKLPPGWKFGTALPVAVSTRNEPDKVQFSPAPLETLIDSPLIAGEFFRSIDLGEIEKSPHRLNIVADTRAALELKAEDEARFRNLVREAKALFGAHHYRGYDFLVTLSDKVAHFGLEHHESSDDRFSEDYFTDENSRTLAAELMPHELAHSWNGKYRRPAGIATPDYQQPVHGEMLWVYEGLTDYLGKVLAARSGLMTETNFRSAFALTAAALDHRDGRSWRSLADTTVSAQLVYDAPGIGTSRRRGPDFYPEGDLVWLEVDTLIRQQSQGKKSLDDFCKQFHGGKNSAPKVVAYDLNEVIRTLNDVATYDWKKFFQQRIYEINPRAPIGGIENGGWKLIYTNEPSALLKIREDKRKYTDVNYSLGFTLGSDGVIGDVLPGSPADKAGIFQSMKLVAVDGRAWSAKILRDALKTAATNNAPIELLTLNEDFYKNIKLNYHGGERYPVLVRDANKPDYIGEIIKPRTPEVVADKK